MELYDIFRAFDFSDNEFEQFRDKFQQKHFQPGELVFDRGAPSDKFYCVVSGELAAVVTDENGNENTLGILHSGEFFGEVGLLKGVARTATIRSLTHSQVFTIDKQGFFELIDKSPAFSIFIENLRLEHHLSRIPAFSKLSDRNLGRIIKTHTTVRVSAGMVICQQNEKSDRLVFIVSGKARVKHHGVDENTTDIHELQPGDYFGDDTLFADTEYIADLEIIEDGEVLTINRESLVNLVNSTPSIAAELPLRKSIVNSILPFFYDKSAYLAIPTVSMNKPRVVMWGTLLITCLLIMFALIPSIWPEQFPVFNSLNIDTDPENMLSKEEVARSTHNRLKKEMNLHDLLVVGVVNENHPDGVYNPKSLSYVYELANFASRQYWKDKDGNTHGVIDVDIMAPSTIDNISQGGPGVISFSWLMPKPPKTRDEALAIRNNIKRLPLLHSTLASEDDKAIALYIPLTSKDVSYRVYQEMTTKISTFDTDHQFFITGLPVAEDSFGVEMFIQMAISAPMAMLVIFLLMYLFFRNLTLIYAPMIVAMVSVMATMALLIITGQTVHIMSSMIPIFIMPIAVLDSVHILSEFFDYYPKIRSRRLTIKHVMRELFVPMFFTSMTTAIGFASLAIVPIPPVQVFGIFVAIGVILAWLLSISLIPAYIFLVNKEKIECLADQAVGHSKNTGGRVGSVLQMTRKLSLKHSRKIAIGSIFLATGLIYGITQIEVNDNPIRWFEKDHPISVADRAMNEHFAGTYMAYISFKGVTPSNDELLIAWHKYLHNLRSDYSGSDSFVEAMHNVGFDGNKDFQLLNLIENKLESRLDSDSISTLEEELAELSLDWLDMERQRYQLFKQPEMLNYLSSFQEHLLTTQIVGKSIAITDFVKTVNRELHSSDESYYKIPDSSSAVAQTLLTYQNSHRPQDVWRFITPDFKQGIVWLMLNSGDNVDMSKVVNAAEEFMVKNPPPFDVQTDWFGLNYINVIWQDKMVNGMMYSILGSYLAVMLIMVFLLRSVLWSLIAMLPLTLTMLVIYGVLGLAGKSYDMPVAVLSALAIGLAVDFAIHFCVRMRHLHSQTLDWEKSLQTFFNEPAQAILRNLLIVAIGFLPLLLAPLVPYNTVGNLIAAILFTSGVITLLMIPSIFNLMPTALFKIRDDRRTTSFGMGEAIYAAVVGYALIIITLTPLLPIQLNIFLGLAIMLFIIIQLIQFNKKLRREV